MYATQSSLQLAGSLIGTNRPSVFKSTLSIAIGWPSITLPSIPTIHNTDTDPGRRAMVPGLAAWSPSPSDRTALALAAPSLPVVFLPHLTFSASASASAFFSLHRSLLQPKRHPRPLSHSAAAFPFLPLPPETLVWSLSWPQSHSILCTVHTTTTLDGNPPSFSAFAFDVFAGQ
ncbi:hypothetical protein SCUP515_02427 [Seiridium cupressi]